MMERVPQPVREMLALLCESGHAPYLVGGCVRDLLRGAEPDDYDMTSDARRRSWPSSARPRTRPG